MKKLALLAILLITSAVKLSAQDKVERNSTDINDIEVWVKQVSLSPKGDTATVQLYLQSYLKNPREFRLNTFATGLIAGDDRPMWYDSMSIGKVIINLQDRQNYLNYLMTRDHEVVLTIKTPNWKKQWGKPKQVKLTFEDHAEEGKFLEYYIDL